MHKETDWSRKERKKYFKKTKKWKQPKNKQKIFTSRITTGMFQLEVNLWIYKNVKCA